MNRIVFLSGTRRPVLKPQCGQITQVYKKTNDFLHPDR